MVQEGEARNTAAKPVAAQIQGFQPGEVIQAPGNGSRQAVRFEDDFTYIAGIEQKILIVIELQICDADSVPFSRVGIEPVAVIVPTGPGRCMEQPNQGMVPRKLESCPVALRRST